MDDKEFTGGMTLAELEAANKPAKPKRGGACGRAARQMTSLAQRFRDEGLDWRKDFATSIKTSDYERMYFWLKLMPYLLTGGKKTVDQMPTKKGRATKLALAKLKELEARGL